MSHIYTSEKRSLRSSESAEFMMKSTRAREILWIIIKLWKLLTASARLGSCVCFFSHETRIISARIHGKPMKFAWGEQQFFGINWFISSFSHRNRQRTPRSAYYFNPHKIIINLSRRVRAAYMSLNRSNHSSGSARKAEQREKISNWFLLWIGGAIKASSCCDCCVNFSWWGNQSWWIVCWMDGELDSLNCLGS
jgi:hypothetical protein